MDPKRLEKLQAIQDWELNPPSKDSQWAEDVKAENLDVKYDYQLQEMLDSHTEKVLKVEKDLDVFTNWPDVKRHELTNQYTQMFKDAKVKENGKLEGKTLQEWIDEEFESQQLFYTWKVAKLNQSNLRIAKEIKLRATGYLEVKEEQLKGTLPEGSKIRIPLGTIYYIDPTNGTDTFAGTRIDSTVDSTADTTHFVDDALTGADDYLNGSYFYNVTRNLGSLITDFVADTDTVTLTTAIAGMAAGDTYYILNAWLDLDQFTENARSAGDKVIIRRGAVQCDDGTDLNFTSDGTVVAPIVIESDFDNLWRDQVDLSATGTATLTFGSVTVTFSADISGVLAAGDWIYASGDDNRDFAYEVKTVSTTTVTLYLPYKGAQAGATRTMYNIQDNPLWNTAAGDFQWNFDTDNFWKVQGLHIRGTDTNGIVEIDSSCGHTFLDCIFTGNDTSLDFTIKFTDDNYYLVSKKCRTLTTSGAMSTLADTFGFVYVYDMYGGTKSHFGGAATALGIINIFDSDFGNGSTYGFYVSNEMVVNTRNSIFSAATTDVNFDAAALFSSVKQEDSQNVVGSSKQSLSIDTDKTDSYIIVSEIDTVRAGGATKSIKVTPVTNLSSVSGWDFSKLCLFELPIYATTDSKTYTVYFNLPDANFSVDPLATELWIELEAWGHATNKSRKITKSSGTITSDGNWNALTVTVAPAQAGVAYLRCYYCKTKEAESNIFYVDPIPVIS
jgi:hypothetical protein